MEKRFKVFVLTLPGDEVRRQPLLDSLTAQGVEYELFFGVDGRKGLPPQYEASIDREATLSFMKRPMSDGEYACALSHRAVCQRMLEDGLDAAVVIEDDALLMPDFGAFLKNGGAFAAPLILLDYSRTSVSRISGPRAGGFGRLYRVIGKPVFTTGYVVSAAAARQLLVATTPVRSVSDWPVDLYLLKAYLISPRLVDHLPVGNHMSHLEADRLQYLPVKAPAKKSIKRLFARSYWNGYLRRRLSRRINP